MIYYHSAADNGVRGWNSTVEISADVTKAWETIASQMRRPGSSAAV